MDKLIIPLLASFFIISCSTTQITQSIKSKDYNTAASKAEKIAVFVITDTTKYAVIFETEIVTALSKLNVDAEAGYVLFKNDNPENQKQEILDSLLALNYDKVVVVRLIDIRDEVEVKKGEAYIPSGSFITTTKYNSEDLTPERSVEDVERTVTNIRLEFQYFSIHNDTSTLLWSARTSTIYKGSIPKLSKDFAKSISKELKKKDVLKTEKSDNQTGMENPSF